ncbi:hypothetical protein MKX08_007909 [Trichoderma sp. CBMAI-0020]|nr:hypothetical protein MKX08_007909 [Trichoderma sp. CBMAI-0020]
MESRPAKHVHTVPRNRPITEASFRSNEDYASFSDDQMSRLVESLRHTTSIDYQILVDKICRGGDQASQQRLLVESLARVNNPGISESEIQDLASTLPLNVSLDEESTDHPGTVVRIPLNMRQGVTLGELLGIPREEKNDVSCMLSEQHGPESESIGLVGLSSGPFVYSPLNPMTREIRLLSLARPSPDGFCITLRHYRLDEAPPFMAVSYCWGDPTPRCDVVCNGQAFQITESLDCALKRIFMWRQDLVLWADGICINQKDVSERASQVKLMGDIYSRAQATAAYLGENLAHDEQSGNSLETDQTPFALMHQLNAVWSEDAEHKHQFRSSDEWTQMQIPAMDDKEGMTIWACLTHLCSQPWFSRSWVLQEVVLAKDVLVFYGSAVDNLQTLVEFWSLATRREPPPAFKYGFVAEWKDGVVNKNQLGIFGIICDGMKEVAEMKSNLSALALHQPGDCGFSLSRGPKFSHTLLSRLIENRSADATDDRDKVYSLLSLAEDAEDMGIQPDYSIDCTATSLYCRVAAAYIKSTYGLLLLNHAGLPQRLGNLPSWVPDWSSKTRQPLDVSLYSCARDTAPEISLLNDGILRVRGSIVDAACVLALKVELQSFIGPLSTDFVWNKSWFIQDDPILPNLPFAADRDRAFGAIVSTAEGLSLSMLRSYPTGESVLDAVWKTLITNRGWMDKKDPEGERFAYEAFCESRQGPFDNEWWPPSSLSAADKEKIWPFQAMVLKANQGYRFGITACGFVGLFPKECLMSDLIAILPGAQTPFVLRPDPTRSSFTLVGDCYVHGMMNGEFLYPRRSGELCDVNWPERRYRIKLHPWNPMFTEKVRHPLRQYFDPDGQKFATVGCLDFH